MSSYRAWDVDQPMLLPPSVTEFVAPSHLVHFVRDLVQRELDLSAVHARYSKDPRGNAPYHPGMMTALMMQDAQTKDDAEDAAHGVERRGDEMPAWAATKKERLAKIREAKAAIEGSAKTQAKRLREERVAAGKPVEGPLAPKALSGEPDPKAQRNFTDPESKILKTADGYVQGYNAQAAVDSEHQVIVATDVVAQQNDSDQVAPMLAQIEANTGDLPREMSADAGYCSEENLALLEERGVRAYVATGRQKHGAAAAIHEDGKKRGPFAAAMRARLRRGGFRSRYRLRKQTVEPVFGQIKEARGFRRFRLRGHRKVRAEWSIVCTAHNVLKLAACAARNARNPAR